MRFSQAHTLVFLCLLLTFGMGSQAQETGSNSTTTGWGDVHTLGQAEQTHAPAAGWINDEIFITTWVAADESEAYHYARAANRRGFTDVQQLPIPPVFPHTQRLIPADNNMLHLFWLDAAYDDIQAGTRLWGALLNTNLTLTRGAFPLSDALIYQYDAIAVDNGTALLVWSEGRRDEPDLMARFVDSLGRPRSPIRLKTGADYPQVTPETGGYRLYWLDSWHENVYTATFDGTVMGEVEPVASLLFMEVGDRLVDFQIGTDATYQYLFWHINRADGTAQTWYTYSPHTSTMWARPTLLAVALDNTGRFVTGYNGGYARRATNGTIPAAWASPLQNINAADALPLATQIFNQLGILYMQGAEVIAWQPIVDLSPIGLIGTPTLYTDRARDLYLFWAQPTNNGYADLNLITTANRP